MSQASSSSEMACDIEQRTYGRQPLDQADCIEAQYIPPAGS